MNTQQKLTKELISHIFNNIGMVPGTLWGKAGITEDIFKIGKKINIQFDDDVYEFPIYAGSCNISDDKINVLAVKISDQDCTEFFMVFRMNGLSIYGLKKSVDEDDLGTFLISTQDGSWTNISMYEKLIFCAGLEKLTDHGIGWVPNENVDVLYKYLLEIVEM